MKSPQLFYKGQQVKVVFNLPNENVKDICLVGEQTTLRNIPVSELTVLWNDYAKLQQELESQQEKIKSFLETLTNGL